MNEIKPGRHLPPTIEPDPGPNDKWPPTIAAALKDPDFVWTAMLRGDIAMPSALKTNHHATQAIEILRAIDENRTGTARRNGPLKTQSPLHETLQAYQVANKRMGGMRNEAFPAGRTVLVHCAKYHGRGIVVLDSLCPLDQVPVLLKNGNTWRYPIECCFPFDIKPR